MSCRLVVRLICWVWMALLMFAICYVEAARRCEATGTRCSWRPEISQRACCSGVCDVPLGQESGVFYFYNFLDFALNLR
ncbi:hypothetical protein BV898_15566 [Hypsibius exemplaris]|uniref:Uncharacterized protein n=1 Tax=Hypsibius exemplaris TaxID=2072580 RepID=A0A9X6RKG2_HYPEX|nr:hypothetical protein BV898_15566 [Hypsibius exemplaris]